jgi:hypothetical protein
MELGARVKGKENDGTPVILQNITYVNVEDVRTYIENMEGRR